MDDLVHLTALLTTRSIAFDISLLHMHAFAGDEQTSDAMFFLYSIPIGCGPGGSGVSFKLLKRGNKGKMEAQEVVVPAATSLAAQVSRNEEANREESSIIKARVRSAPGELVARVG